MTTTNDNDYASLNRVFRAYYEALMNHTRRIKSLENRVKQLENNNNNLRRKLKNAKRSL